jgi:outer membrane protein assembly factor BamA
MTLRFSGFSIHARLRPLARLGLLGAFVAGATVSAAAAGQSELEPTSRTALLIQLRQEKAKALHPFVPEKLEAVAMRVENDYLPRLFTPKTGFYPRFGSIVQGGGFALGPGYRQHGLFGGPGDLFVSGAYSLKHYWIGEVRMVLPELAHRRMFADVYARRTGYSRQPYYGLGNETTKGDFTTFSQDQTTIGGHVGVRPARYVSAGGGAEYLNIGIGPGHSPRFPSIEESFNEATAPGLTTHPDFIRTFAFASLDYGDPVGSPRSGARYKVQVNRYDDRDGGHFDFRQTTVDLQQYLSAFNQRRVLALRAFGTFSNADGGREVPFYLMPTLGGNNTLRGFRDYRFRDRNALIFQAEYRFEIFTVMDGALFYDTGQVAARRQDLTDDLRKDYGIGFRFGTDQGVFIRVDVAFGSGEGIRPFVAFSHVF